ncbi:MAG TPA: hypothetical protein PLQ35_14665 [bacterium]|nr:hypothetical protein [bacterium]HQL63526.1 hypothetical protein [bacterium]
MTRYFHVSFAIFLAAMCSIVCADVPTGPFVYVVALERDAPGEQSIEWQPTLYKISVPGADISKKIRLANDGFPSYCKTIGAGTIEVAMEYGIASNGTRPGDPSPAIAKIVTINKETMAIEEIRVIPDPQNSLYQPTDAEKHAERFASQHTFSGTLLGMSNNGNTIYVLDGYRSYPTVDMVAKSPTGASLVDWCKPVLKMLDGDSCNEKATVPIHVPEINLGGMPDSRNCLILDEKYLLCLFEGGSSLGWFAPGYVMILDLKTRAVRFVQIGSDPAIGIAQ